jgi:FkbM family methyltransferase
MILGKARQGVEKTVGTLLQPHELAGFDRQSAEAAIRCRTQNAYLGDHVALGRVLGRYKLFVDTHDIGFGSHLILDGFWEIWLTLFCARNVRTGMTAIDVGAHLGYYSVMFGEFVGFSGRVMAVEPNPKSCELLRRSIDLNGFSARTTVFSGALGAIENERLPLYVPPFEPKNGLIIAHAEDFNPRRGAVIEVDSTTLDRLCAGVDRIDFVKIDAEGSEERIFDGMSKTIARNRPMIVMEFNAARYLEPATFVERLHEVYGALYAIDFEGAASPVTSTELLNQRVGEDWLVVLSPQRPA